MRRYLGSRGIAAERLTAAGYGSAQPVADNKSAAGREANRRVEFHIVEDAKAKPKPKDGATPAEEPEEAPTEAPQE